MKKNDENSLNAATERTPQESRESLGDPEVHNLNNKMQQRGAESEAAFTKFHDMNCPSPLPEKDVVVELGPEDLQRYQKQAANPKVRNADNSGLGPIGQGIIIGYVDQVNGSGAEEFEGFVPTRYELIQLAKHWAKVAIDIEYFWFCYEQPSSSEIRLRPFAWRRVNRIADVLGDEAVQKAVDAAYEEYGKRQDARTWNIFLNGTPEERKALQDEIAREIAGNGGAEPDSGGSSPDGNRAGSLESAA